MLRKEDIIQKLITANRYQSYLEIGSQNSFCFDRVRCKYKRSVDPDPAAKATYPLTSDEYFIEYNQPYDLVFIDGWHSAEQLERDIVNSSKVLTAKGAIVVHDLNPAEEIQTLIPRVNKQWVGTCYKAFVGFRQKYPFIQSYTHPEDWGVGIIKPGGLVFEPGFILDISFEEFMENKKDLLNFV